MAQTTFHFEFMQNMLYLWGPPQGRRTISALSEGISFLSWMPHPHPLGKCKLLTIPASSPLLINLTTPYDGWKKALFLFHLWAQSINPHNLRLLPIYCEKKDDGKNIHRSAGPSSNNQRHCPEPLALFYTNSFFVPRYWKIYYRPLWMLQKGQKSKYY